MYEELEKRRRGETEGVCVEALGNRNRALSLLLPLSCIGLNASLDGGTGRRERKKKNIRWLDDDDDTCFPTAWRPALLLR